MNASLSFLCSPLALPPGGLSHGGHSVVDVPWQNFGLGALIAFGALVFLIVFFNSIHSIGPTQVGLVIKRFGAEIKDPNNPLAMHGEAGYQGRLLTRGVRWALWPFNVVQKHDWPQIPADEIGLVIAQIGGARDQGWKTGIYRKEFGQFTDIEAFLKNGGQKGMQRYVLAPGELLPIHPVAFLVLTSTRLYGLPVMREYQEALLKNGDVDLSKFGLTKDDFKLVTVPADQIGIVRTQEGPALPDDAIACRLGGFADIASLETDEPSSDMTVIERLLSSQNAKHNNYQDYQAFLENGGCLGLQHDPLLCGQYALHPMLVKVEFVQMLSVDQGQAAVIKSFVGRPPEDVSGKEFQYGTIVRPGRRGLWKEALRTGKYPLNTHIYSPIKVPTYILTLNWIKNRTGGHGLDANLEPIEALSKEGFKFVVDVQVQIHIPDTLAAEVISSVGSIDNLVGEVMRPAVGNFFRNKIQSMEAKDFIEKRGEVQEAATLHVREQLRQYKVEVLGVFIQDQTPPQELVNVLKAREIAKQNIATFEQEKGAQEKRIEMEKARGMADKQLDLSSAEIGVTIATHVASARRQTADGDAYFTEKTGEAEAKRIKAIGKAQGEAYQSQKDALGAEATAIVNVVHAIADGHVQVMPQILVMGGGGSIDGLAATLMGSLSKVTSTVTPTKPETASNAPSLTPSVPVNGQGSGPAIPPVNAGTDAAPAA